MIILYYKLQWYFIGFIVSACPIWHWKNNRKIKALNRFQKAQSASCALHQSASIHSKTRHAQCTFLHLYQISWLANLNVNKRAAIRGKNCSYPLPPSPPHPSSPMIPFVPAKVSAKISVTPQKYLLDYN